MLSIKLGVERVVISGTRAGGRIADIWVPAKETAPRLSCLPRFAG